MIDEPENSVTDARLEEDIPFSSEIKGRVGDDNDDARSGEDFNPVIGQGDKRGEKNRTHRNLDRGDGQYFGGTLQFFRLPELVGCGFERWSANSSSEATPNTIRV